MVSSKAKRRRNITTNAILSLPTAMMCLLVISSCVAFDRLFAPPPARVVRVDARPPQEEITRVYVYNFAEKHEKAGHGFRLRSDIDRACDDMEEGFNRGTYAYFMKNPVQIEIDTVRDLKHKGGGIEAYIAMHLDTERNASARYRLILDPYFYYRDKREPQLPEGTVTLTVSLTRIADNKLVWEADYYRWTSGYYYNGGYMSMAQETAEQALADLFGPKKP